MRYVKLFEPYCDLARHLLPAIEDLGDGSHDLLHIARVWYWCRRLHQKLGGRQKLLFAAAFLHDCVHVEKNALDREHASRHSACKARQYLGNLHWPEADIDDVAHAIEAHSYSAGIRPRTLEAMILQDSDRLETIGAIGIARCFYVAGRIGSVLYDADDPLGLERSPQELSYVLDHYGKRLLKYSSNFQTQAARSLAAEKASFTRKYFDILLQEIRAVHKIQETEYEVQLGLSENNFINDAGMR